MDHWRWRHHCQCQTNAASALANPMPFTTELPQCMGVCSVELKNPILPEEVYCSAIDTVEEDVDPLKQCWIVILKMTCTRRCI